MLQKKGTSSYFDFNSFRFFESMRETSAQTVAPTLHGGTPDRQGSQPAPAVQPQQEQIAARIVAAQVGSPAANLAVNPTGMLRIPAPRIAALADADQIPAHPAQQAEKGELLFGTVDTWLIWSGPTPNRPPRQTGHNSPHRRCADWPIRPAERNHNPHNPQTGHGADACRSAC